MATRKIGAKSTEQLDELKGQISNSFRGFSTNAKRFRQWMRLTFKSTFEPDDLASLGQQQKPQAEANLGEAAVSRVLTEFSMMEPSFVISPEDGVDSVNQKMIDCISAHIRHAFKPSANDNLLWDLALDQVSGGYAVGKIWTDYASPMSFHQNIYLGKAHDPTLCVFDLNAKLSHKGDGNFCGEVYTRSEDEAVAEFGSKVLQGIGQTIASDIMSDVGQLNWTYDTKSSRVLLFADYWEKCPKRTKIVELSNRRVLTEKAYEYLVEEWDKRGILAPAPVAIKSRWSMIDHVIRYRLNGGQILDRKETDFQELPLIFIDGNSRYISDTSMSTPRQYTRPLLYNTYDIQKACNYTLSSLMNEIENKPMQQWIGPVGSIGQDQVDAIKTPQQAQMIFYNQYQDKDKDRPLQAPQPITKQPIDNAYLQVIEMIQKLMNVVMGSFDNSVVNGGNMDLSGEAIMQAQMQSNGAYGPFLTNYYKGINRMAQVYVNLTPKYYRTPRSLPIITLQGKREYVKINSPDPGALSMNYNMHNLNVSVEAGVNFAVQKQISLKVLVSLTKSLPDFAAFIGQYGLETVLDQLDIRGIEGLKEMASEYQKQKAQQQQAAGEQPTQGQIDMAKIQAAKYKTNVDALVELETAKAKDAIAQDSNAINLVDILSKFDVTKAEQQEKVQRVDAENARTAVQSVMEISDHAMKLEELNMAKERHHKDMMATERVENEDSEKQ